MIIVFEKVTFMPAFSLSSFSFIKRLFSSCSLSAIKVLPSAYFRLLIISLAILIPALASSSPEFHMMYSAHMGVDRDLDHDFLIAKFRLNLKKVGKSTRTLKYELNHIPYNYTVEVRNIFKGLDPIDRVPKKLWMEVLDIVQEEVIKTTPKKKKNKKA